MSADAALSSTGTPMAWIAPAVPTGTPSLPQSAEKAFGFVERLNEKISTSGYAGGNFLVAQQGFVTMSDALLKSIDKRLQDVSKDVTEMRLQLNTVENKIILVEKDVKGLPTWKGVFGAASAAIGTVGTAVAGAITWLAGGGAKTLLKLLGV